MPKPKASDIGPVISRVDLQKLLQLVKKMGKVFSKNEYDPMELYLACQFIAIDLEREFDTRLLQKARTILDYWRKTGGKGG